MKSLTKAIKSVFSFIALKVSRAIDIGTSDVDKLFRVVKAEKEMLTSMTYDEQVYINNIGRYERKANESQEEFERTEKQLLKLEKDDPRRMLVGKKLFTLARSRDVHQKNLNTMKQNLSNVQSEMAELEVSYRTHYEEYKLYKEMEQIEGETVKIENINSYCVRRAEIKNARRDADTVDTVTSDLEFNDFMAQYNN